MIGKDQLAAAARENDRIAETKGFGEASAAAGVDEEGMLYVAQQRALRLVLKIGKRPIPDGWDVVHLDAEEKAMLRVLTIAEVDGIAIGLRAAKENR